MEKRQAIRHGDMAIMIIDEIPEGLTESKDTTFMIGSNNNPHGFNGKGQWYPAPSGDFQLGFFKSVKGTILLHTSHGVDNKPKIRGMKQSKVLPVRCYEVVRQNEDTNEGMKPVVD